ncbi:MAG: protein kinase [Akkermansiaceae bacterium]|nr:protein kinase [Akkermansiaceae bacterium]
MEDRYEIRGKIGHGGLGTVYRGFDMKMKREVAIKRIMTSEEDPSIQEEATKQLASEAGALASLQHPHIVTVYDVGQDEDGPYVVMELINGKTLDDIIEEHALVWEDFRELAMQTQEALIAAQELDMIHSDIKPPNIMMTWLPSGKFQIKIVDFGLAVLAQNQSKEEIEQLETVFGSIFFMPPEQFEREILDARSDLYSMGCVYYQCLTGKYPFSGDDGNEVMEAHLNHEVVPIQEIRAGIPIWVCDWVMWLINRDPADRPQSSREALAVFLKNCRSDTDPEMSTGTKPKAGPKLIIPGQEAAADPDAPPPVEGKPILPPDITTSVEMMASYEEPEEKFEDESVPAAAAVPVQPRTLGGHSLMHPTQGAGTQPQAHTTQGVDMASSQTTQTIPFAKPEKKPMSGAMKGMIAVLLGILVVVSGIMLLNRSNKNKRNEILNELINKAKDESVEEVPMTLGELKLLLDTVSYGGKMENREQYYNALYKAKSEDGTNFSTTIFKHATETALKDEVRDNLFTEVLKRRGNPEMVSTLVKYAAAAPDAKAGVAALKACMGIAEQVNANALLDIITSDAPQQVRTQAERVIADIIDRTPVRDGLTRKIISSYSKAKDAKTRHALIRLLGHCSTDGALDKIKEALGSEENKTRLAASSALGEWQDARAIDVLLGYLSGVADPAFRESAFDALLKLAQQEFVMEDEAKAKEVWTKIMQEATTSREKLKFINTLVPLWDGEPWSTAWRKPLVQKFVSDGDPQVNERAKKGISAIKDREALKKKEAGTQE